MVDTLIAVVSLSSRSAHASRLSVSRSAARARATRCDLRRARLRRASRLRKANVAMFCQNGTRKSIRDTHLLSHRTAPGRPGLRACPPTNWHMSSAMSMTMSSQQGFWSPNTSSHLARRPPPSPPRASAHHDRHCASISLLTIAPPGSRADTARSSHAFQEGSAHVNVPSSRWACVY